MALALQRNLERWFCKLGTLIDLSFLLLGLGVCLHSLRNLPCWRFSLTGKENGRPQGTTLTTAKRPAGTRPGHLGFHNRRCMASGSLLIASPSKNDKETQQCTLPKGYYRTGDPACEGLEQGGYEDPSCPQTSQLAFHVGLRSEGHTWLACLVTMTKQFSPAPPSMPTGHNFLSRWCGLMRILNGASAEERPACPNSYQL